MPGPEARIPHSRPDVGRAELKAVARVLRSGQLAQGGEVARLEEEFAARLGFLHAVAVSSGTAALHLALTALGVRAGDRVVAPSYVCVAVLNAIRYVGAREALVDAEPGGFQLDAAAAAAAPGVKAAVVPHLFGYAADAAPLTRKGVPVIEDCAMALGSRTAAGEPVGRQGACAVFSFYATKTVAGGEGGMFATDDAALAAEVRDLRAYDQRASFRVRYNYKLTDLQAALVRVQIRRLDALLARRRRVAERYFAALDPGAATLPPRVAGATYARFVLRAAGGLRALARRFERAGIEVARPVYRPLHRYLRLEPAAFPNAEEQFLTAFSLPIYPTLAPREVVRVAAVVNSLAGGRAGPGSGGE